MVTIIMTAISLMGVLGGVVGPMLWITVAIEGLLAAGFVYFYRTS